MKINTSYLTILYSLGGETRSRGPACCQAFQVACSTWHAIWVTYWRICQLLLL